MFSLEAQGVNTFLVYEVKPEDIVDTVTFGMLKNNTIEGLLPFSYFQMDLKQYYKYNITSKITLDKFLMEVVSKNQILTIWSQIVKILVQSEEYMIRENNYILDCEQIYINVGTLKIEMICFPVQRQENDVENFFKTLIYKMHYSQNEDTSYVIQLIEYFNGTEPFSILGLQELLQKLNSTKAMEKKPVAKKSVTIQQIAPEPMPQGMSHNFESTYRPPVANPVQPQTVSGINVPQMSVPAQSTPVQSTPMQFTAMPPEKPEKKGFFFKKKEDKKEKKAKKEKKKPVKTNENINMNPINTPFPVPGEHNNVLFPQNSQVQEVPKEAYTMVKENFGETTVLKQEIGETTVLSQQMQNQENTGRSKYIVRMSNQQKVLINKPVFKLGKEASYVDLCISDNSNISRTHADIFESAGQLYICDNNSTNHTYVNEEMVMPGEHKPLNSGDKIKLADEEFEIKIF